MATAGGVRAGRAFVEAYLDKDALERGLKVAERRLKSFASGVENTGRRLIGAGAAILTPLVLASKTLAAQSLSISDIANATGLGVEKIQRLVIGMQILGVRTEEAVAVLVKLSDSTGKAMSGSAELVKWFQRLGISMEELKKMSPDERIDRVFEALRRIQDPATRVAAGSALMSEQFRKLGDVFSMTKKEFEDLTRALKEGGLLLSDEDVRRGQELNRMWVELTITAKKLAAVLAAIFQPSVIKVIDWFAGMIIKLKPLLEKNGPLIAGALAFAAAIVVLGSGMQLLVFALKPFIFMAFKLVAGVKLLWGLFIGLKTAVVALFVALSGPGWTAMGTFILGGLAMIAIVAGITATILSLWYLSQTVFKHLEGFMEGLSRSFAEVGTAFKNTLGGMYDAIRAGNLELAGKIMITGFKLVIFEGLTGLAKAVLSLMANMATRIVESISIVATTLMWLGQQIAIVMIEAGHWIASAFSSIMTSIATFQEAAATSLAAILLKIQAKKEGWSKAELADKLKDLQTFHNTEVEQAKAAAEAKSKADEELHKKRMESIKNEGARQIGVVDDVMKKWQDGIKEGEAGAGEWLDAMLGIPMLRNELEQLRSQAKRELEEAKKEKSKKQPPPPPEVKKLTQQAAGQFGAWSTRALQAKGPMNRLVNASEKTAENTKEMNAKLDAGINGIAVA